MLIVVVDGKIKTKNQKRVIGIQPPQMTTAKTFANTHDEELNQQ